MWNLIINKFWTGQDIQLIIERARTITTTDATILATTLQSGTTAAATAYEQSGVGVATFNAATTIAARNTEIASKKMINAWLKI